LERLRARQNVVVARTPRCDPNSWVASAQAIYNSDWKRSIGEADWVVVTNLDEHVFHPNMAGYLQQMLQDGVTVVPAAGYQMMSEKFPAPDSVLWRDHPLGAPWNMYSRLPVFRPDQITETNYKPGRHGAALVGNVVLPNRVEAMNLHFKYLGLEETRLRHAEQRERLGAKDVANGWGSQYNYSDDELAEVFGWFQSKRVNVHDVAEHDSALWRGLPRRRGD